MLMALLSNTNAIYFLFFEHFLGKTNSTWTNWLVSFFRWHVVVLMALGNNTNAFFFFVFKLFVGIEPNRTMPKPLPTGKL
jgi:hypothetical protein